MTTIYHFKKVVNFLLTMRGIASVLLAIAFAALAFALTAEHLWSVKPCVLCTYQRYVFLVLMGLSLSGYHVGVEQHWWKGPDACSTTAPMVDAKASQADQIKAFRAKMKQQSTTITRCDEVNWRILGVSATMWTFALYIGLIGFLSMSYACRKSIYTST